MAKYLEPLCLEQNTEYVKECVRKNQTYRQISDNFKREFPEVNRGFLEKNIRLFCLNNSIRKPVNLLVDNVIQQSISEVLHGTRTIFTRVLLKTAANDRGCMFTNSSCRQLFILYGTSLIECWIMLSTWKLSTFFCHSLNRTNECFFPLNHG